MPVFLFSLPIKTSSHEDALSLALANAVYFEKALKLMDSKNYEEAASGLELALRESPIIGDYALFHRARALKELKREEEARQCLQALFGQYPKSPLMRKARALDIQLAADGKTKLPLLAGYVKDYPDDEDMSLRLGLMLKAEGSLAEAREVLLRVYISGNKKASADAMQALGRPLTAAELTQRAETLMKRFKTAEAEQALRAALKIEGSKKEKEIKNLLAKSLFMQKRYKESATLYIEAENPYEAARAFFRADEEAPFLETLRKLVKKGDERAANLLIAHAAKKRRNHSHEEALGILADVKENYPSKREDALWETGWLFYMKKQYTDAFAAFSELAFDYRKPIYHYWKARSMEALGGDPGDIYKRLLEENNYGYYALLSSYKGGGPSARASEASIRISNGPSPGGISLAPYSIRAEVLLKAGLREDALTELMESSKQSQEPERLVEIALRLKELGDFKRAIQVASYLPERLRPAEVLYPKAYWDLIEKSCTENGFDPYLAVSVMREESRFDPTAYSPAGAAGLMQLMPDTAKKLSRHLNIGLENETGIYEIDANLAIGVYYLRKLLGEFNGIAPALAAYNAGESSVRKWLKDGGYASMDEFVEDIPYNETKNYVKRIISTYSRYVGEEAARGVSGSGVKPGIL